jgi:hypothetical protein
MKEVAYDIGAPLGGPVMSAIATLPLIRVTMRSGHIVGKSTLINEYKRVPFFLMFFNFLAKYSALFAVRFGVMQSLIFVVDVLHFRVSSIFLLHLTRRAMHTLNRFESSEKLRPYDF